MAGSDQHLSSDRDLAGVWCNSKLHAGFGVWVNADAQQAGKVHALGAVRASSQDAGEGTVLVPSAGVLQDAHGLGRGALRHIRWARARVALGGAHAAAGTLHLRLGLVALAGRLLVVALAGSGRGRRRRRRWRRRWGRRWARLARHDGVGRLALDAALAGSCLAALQLHVALLTPAGSPAVPQKNAHNAVIDYASVCHYVDVAYCLSHATDAQLK